MIIFFQEVYLIITQFCTKGLFLNKGLFTIFGVFVYIFYYLQKNMYISVKILQNQILQHFVVFPKCEHFLGQKIIVKHQVTVCLPKNYIVIASIRSITNFTMRQKCIKMQLGNQRGQIAVVCSQKTKLSQQQINFTQIQQLSNHPRSLRILYFSAMRALCTSSQNHSYPVRNASIFQHYNFLQNSAKKCQLPYFNKIDIKIVHNNIFVGVHIFMVKNISSIVQSLNRGNF
eukprot:TRINITY_DN13694_c1_g1_i3.p1 TRINITY_DN13694_c1_g1~~TRINITY_DN13694_c1_g1_i3.p1  ORF type:complete len:230 (+),score=-12.04 TRINITY_DN13694_c1_g1_i3:288-977(+)